MFECSCPECYYTYEIADELAGKSVICPTCNKRFMPRGETRARRRQDEQHDERAQNRVRRQLGGGIGILTLMFGVAAGVLLASCIVCAGCTMLVRFGSSQLPPGDMSLKGFILQKPEGPTAVQTDCELSTFYSYAFSRCAETHYSFQIVDSWPSQVVIVWAYAPKNSGHGKRLYQLLKNGDKRKFTLRIQRIGPDGQKLPAEYDNCFSLVGIVE